MTEKRFYCYALFRLDNGDCCYIGKGTGKRAFTHQSALRNHKNPHLKNIILKHGVSALIMKEDLTEAEAFETERTLIAAIGRRVNGGTLVNLTDGGEGGSGNYHTEETKARIAAKMREVSADPEVRAKRSAEMKDRVVSDATLKKLRDNAANPEIRAKISTALLAKGMTRSPETREKMGAPKRGKKLPPEQVENMRAAQIERMKDPAIREQVSEKTKAAWQDPEKRARFVEAQRRRREREAAEKKARLSG